MEKLTAKDVENILHPIVKEKLVKEGYLEYVCQEIAKIKNDYYRKEGSYTPIAFVENSDNGLIVNVVVDDQMF